MFIAWGAVAVWAMARPAQRGWIEALVAVAIAFAAVPIVNALTTDRSLLASVVSHDWAFAGFDMAMIAIAAGFGFAALKVARREAGRGRARGAKTRPQSGVAA